MRSMKSFLEEEARNLYISEILHSDLDDYTKIECIKESQDIEVTPEMLKYYLESINEVDGSILNEMSQTTSNILKYGGALGLGAGLGIASGMNHYSKELEMMNKVTDVHDKFKSLGAKDIGWDKFEESKRHLYEDIGVWGIVGSLGIASILYIYRNYVSKKKNCNKLSSNENLYLKCIMNLNRQTMAELEKQKKECDVDACINKINKKIDSFDNENREIMIKIQQL